MTTTQTSLARTEAPAILAAVEALRRESLAA
jgi:hypothetical protein